jgi:protein-S-isoprenylcysteine O-methyltransferase Ste14
MKERPDNPGVRFPPPFIYAAAVIGGWLLNRRWPFPIGGERSREIAAAACGLSFLALTATSIERFRRARTTLLPMRPASTMVMTGPYRFTRNPMYLGLALLSLAFALFFNTWWIAILLTPTVFLMNRLVIAREEAYLRRRFGAEYEAYCRKVRRWI